MEEVKTINIWTRRWLVREIESGRLTVKEVLERIELHSKNPESLLWLWRRKYRSETGLTLPSMTEKEQQELAAVNMRLEALEKALDLAKMKNIALETMIDIAEDKFKISIRKKSGPKQ
ncbi:MAG: hypothetical protein IT262_06325 [Saprospiraceae bacterium]|nr:hypothetical protein [Saprospiraceae bacterium]